MPHIQLESEKYWLEKLAKEQQQIRSIQRKQLIKTLGLVGFSLFLLMAATLGFTAVFMGEDWLFHLPAAGGQ